MNTKHTPGPWKPTIIRWPNGQLKGIPYIYAPNGDDGGRHVCELYNNGQLDANAGLIASAPELLDACRSLMAYVEASGWGDLSLSGTGNPALDKLAESTVVLTRAALVKVDGKTQS